MRSEKGVTLLMLVITVVITLIIAGSAVYSGIETYKGMRVKTFSEQLSIVKERVTVIKEKAKTNSEIKLYALGKGITEAELGTELYNQAKLAIAKTGANYQDYRFFDSKSLKSDLDIDIEDFIVAIDFDNNKVVGVKGVEYEGEAVYSQEQIDEINK